MSPSRHRSDCKRKWVGHEAVAKVVEIGILNVFSIIETFHQFFKHVALIRMLHTSLGHLNVLKFGCVPKVIFYY